MSIRTSIYDFFSYTIPGGILLFIILIGMNLFGVSDILIEIYKSRFSDILIITILSYIIGHLTSSLNSKWAKLFESRLIHNLAFKEFKQKHPNVEIKIDPNDWQIWFASIRRESTELALEVDRAMATSYFLRGVSFSLAFSSLIILISIIFGKLYWACILLVAVLGFFSFISVKESIKFNKWFYFLIFELVISRDEPYFHSKK